MGGLVMNIINLQLCRSVLMNVEGTLPSLNSNWIIYIEQHVGRLASMCGGLPSVCGCANISRVHCCWRRGLASMTWASDHRYQPPPPTAMHPGELAHLQITPTPEQRERHVTNSLQSVDHTDQPSFIIALHPSPSHLHVYTSSSLLDHDKWQPPAQTVQLTTQLEGSFPLKWMFSLNHQMMTQLTFK